MRVFSFQERGELLISIPAVDYHVYALRTHAVSACTLMHPSVAVFVITRTLIPVGPRVLSSFH